MNLDLQKEIIIKELKDDLTQFTNKDLYECSCCGYIFSWNDANYNPEKCTYTCENCRQTFDETELQNVSVLDYVEDMYLSYKVNKNNFKGDTDE